MGLHIQGEEFGPTVIYYHLRKYNIRMDNRRQLYLQKKRPKGENVFISLWNRLWHGKRYYRLPDEVKIKAVVVSDNNDPGLFIVYKNEEFY